jgi:hypothetical protein
MAFCKLMIRYASITPRDIGTEPRKPLSPMKRLRIFEMRGGLCCVCTNRITAGEPFIDEHGRALGLGGSNDDGNRYIAHVKCAAIKTREEDMPRIAKAKRQKASSLGLKRSKGRPLPCGKHSRWRKKMNGQVVPRNQERRT